MLSHPAAAENLSAADHAWLRMERPDNRVIIHLAFVFEGRLTLEALASRLRERLLAYPAFTHRIERRRFGARWVADAEFHLERHLREHSLTAGAGDDALQAWMASQAPLALPTDRPLWQATLVHGVTGSDGQPRSALVMRVHHSLADGMSLMHVITGLTDLASGEQAREAARTAQRQELTLTTTLRRAGRVLADAWRLAVIPGDRKTALKGRPQQHKAVAWSAPLPLDAVHALAHQQGGTVNDVMLALIAQALREDLQRRGQPLPASPLRCVVPLNMRPSGEEDQLGNRFGLVGCDLPIHLDTPLGQMQAVQQSMGELKRSFQGQLALTLVRLAGRLPQWAQDLVLILWARRCTLIITNVIGPADKRSLGGVALNELMLLVPQGMSVGVGVSIISYAGQLRVGFLVDKKLMPDCAAAAQAIGSAFERLCQATGVPAVAQPEHVMLTAQAEPLPTRLAA